MRSIKETALAFDRACRVAAVRYALIGGFAVMAWGQPRATTDVDALTRLDGVGLNDFVGALAAEDLRVAREDLEDAVDEGGHVTVFDAQSSYHVDLKPARTEAEKDQVETATEVAFETGRLRVASAEHTVAYKLLYGSERDLQDVRSILAKLGRDLDRAKLARIAARLDVAAQLATLMKEVQEP